MVTKVPDDQGTCDFFDWLIEYFNYTIPSLQMTGIMKKWL